jgi:hypothetical protein
MRRAVTKSGIAISRDEDGCGKMRNLRVLIDGREVGRVSYGKRIQYALDPGIYVVQVQMDWCRSEAFAVYVHDGEVVQLAAGLRWFGWSYAKNIWASFFEPSRMYAVRPTTARSPSRQFMESMTIRLAMAISMLLLLTFFWLCSQLG